VNRQRIATQGRPPTRNVNTDRSVAALSDTALMPQEACVLPVMIVVYRGAVPVNDPWVLAVIATPD
jgi:hypothetical protein